jgi:hypothetical protein
MGLDNVLLNQTWMKQHYEASVCIHLFLAAIFTALLFACVGLADYTFGTSSRVGGVLILLAMGIFGNVACVSCFFALTGFDT